MITEETIARMKINLEIKNEFFVLDFIKHLEEQIEEQKKLIETQYAENQTLGNNNAKLLHLYGECKKENEELKKDKERLGKRDEILTNIIMDAFKINVDLCPLCKSKGEHLPDCECLTDEACLKQLIGLYGE